jgi:hypothetical protein
MEEKNYPFKFFTYFFKESLLSRICDSTLIVFLHAKKSNKPQNPSYFALQHFTFDSAIFTKINTILLNKWVRFLFICCCSFPFVSCSCQRPMSISFINIALGYTLQWKSTLLKNRKLSPIRDNINIIILFGMSVFLAGFLSQ